jgi:hypothetical protein
VQDSSILADLNFDMLAVFLERGLINILSLPNAAFDVFDAGARGSGGDGALHFGGRLGELHFLAR